MGASSSNIAIYPPHVAQHLVEAMEFSGLHADADVGAAPCGRPCLSERVPNGVIDAPRLVRLGTKL